MAPNPNPARTTAPMWTFTERVVALEPHDFVWSGCYVFKSGYHATVNDNKVSWPNSYSIKLPADLRGPFDKGRAVDIKSKQAAAGQPPVIMAKYGSRMKAAAQRRDPRVKKWREVLGQFDTDTPPEAIDFQTVAERVPDDTHVWHFHWSILTEFVNDPEAYDAMYSVLVNQSLADYQAGGIAKMQVVSIGVDGSGQLYAFDGMYARRINQGDIAHMRTLANEGRFILLNDQTPRAGFYPGAYGFDLTELQQSAAILRGIRWMWDTDEEGYVKAGGDRAVWRFGGGMGENTHAKHLTKLSTDLAEVSGKVDEISVPAPDPVGEETVVTALESDRGQAAITKAANAAEDS